MLFQVGRQEAKSPHNEDGHYRPGLWYFVLAVGFSQPFQPPVLSICTLRNNLHLKMTASCESATVQNSRWCLNTAK